MGFGYLLQALSQLDDTPVAPSWRVQVSGIMGSTSYVWYMIFVHGLSY